MSIEVVVFVVKII